ncbi:MAG: DUF5723 family protein [Bacteroidetes bacterium]|nr:DUF5723 family protein [Bacteroidota bacterium]
MNKFYIFVFISWFCSLPAVYSQTEINSFNAIGGGYSTTFLADYQCLGINPANLGWVNDKHHLTLGFLETGVSLYTNALSKSQVTNDLFNNNISLTLSQKLDAAQRFTNTKLWGQVGVTWLGVSYYNEQAGGFAVSVRDRILWNTTMDAEAAQFLFLGYHAAYFDSLVVKGIDTTGYTTNPKPISLVYGGTKLQFIWYREYNFGYGRKIIDNDILSIYAGIGLKYLEGYGSFNFVLDNNQLTAFSSLGPEFNINYSAPTPSQISGNGVKKVGSGFGLDIGLTFRILKKIKIGLAINDIGYINWNGNVYQANDIAVFKIKTPGINNYNIFNAGQLIKIDGLPSDSNAWKGLSSKRVNLPIQLRGGASYRIIPQLEVGVDAIVPFQTKVPGAIDKGIFGIGLRIEPIKWVEISAGLVTGADVGVNIPFGLTLYPVRNEKSTWEIGVATRDFPIIFKREDIMASLAFGFLRVSF